MAFSELGQGFRAAQREERKGREKPVHQARALIAVRREILPEDHWDALQGDLAALARPLPLAEVYLIGSAEFGLRIK